MKRRRSEDLEAAVFLGRRAAHDFLPSEPNCGLVLQDLPYRLHADVYLPEMSDWWETYRIPDKQELRPDGGMANHYWRHPWSNFPTQLDSETTAGLTFHLSVKE